MSTLLLIVALLLSYRGEHDHALITALVALTFAVLRLRPGWLGREWNAAIHREQRKTETLFEGRRDD